MKRLYLLSTAVTLLFVSGIASANSIVIGGKAGVIDIDASGYDPTIIGSVQLGYEFIDVIAADFGFDLEVSESLEDGDGPGGNDYDFEQVGLFASVRSAGPIYVIGRAGIVDTTITLGGSEDSDSGTAYGVGIGFSTGLRWEVEYTTYDYNDIDINQLTLGLSVSF